MMSTPPATPPPQLHPSSSRSFIKQIFAAVSPRGRRRKHSGVTYLSRGENNAAAAGTTNSTPTNNANTIKNKLVLFGDSATAYDLEDLLRASAEVLGKGTCGTTYKASLDNGLVVAVKRLRNVSVTDDVFKAKMEQIGRFNHQNLASLRAYYCSRDEKLLIYDYVSAGSLSGILHGNQAASRTSLNWETRSKIALGAARALAYIHLQDSTSSHGNFKSTNIFLTKSSFEARVSESGIAHVTEMGRASNYPNNRVVGTESSRSRKVSQKDDVYRFGIFLLELLTGKEPLENNERGGVDLPRWVQSVVQEWSAGDVLDTELLKYRNIEDEMVQLLQLAVDCAAQNEDSRPTMEDVTSQIQNICSLS